jgi:hypothetical protein
VVDISLAGAGEERLQRGAGCFDSLRPLILQAWGRLEEALALHKKEEAICLELGNKSSLAYRYWNWGLLERDLGNPEREQAKLSAASALFRELRMPREQDAVEAELAGQPKIPETSFVNSRLSQFRRADSRVGAEILRQVPL